MTNRKSVTWFSITLLTAFFMKLLISSSFAATRAAEEEPVNDTRLENRLVRESVYLTKPGDTLHRVAHLLYGHSTWWTKLQESNPRFKKLNETDALPVGVKINYLSPEVGERYVVQKNDWLVRIAEWKYGATDYWQALFQKNMGKIKNPDLIHPGDVLILTLDGEVKNSSTGETLMQAVNAPAQEAAPPAPVAPEPPKDLASRTVAAVEESDIYKLTLEYPYFFVGLLSGLALLFLFLLWSVAQRFRYTPAEVQAKANRTRYEHERQAAANEPDLKAYPYTFKRRAPEDPEFDKSLIRKDAREVDLRPGYHSLFGSLGFLRKYTKLWRKK